MDMVQPFFLTVRSLSEWALAHCGVCLSISGMKLPREGAQLSHAGARGHAAETAQLLDRNRETCLRDGVPVLKRVEERNAWLLFSFTDAYFSLLQRELLLVSAPPLPAETENHFANRLGLLARKGGKADCPVYSSVQNALWRCCAAHDRGRWTRDTERTVLAMTHSLSDRERLSAEQSVGGTAAAILTLWRTTT